MMATVTTTELIDPDRDFASHYRDGGDPDRDCPRLYQWHLALWGRPVLGVAPFTLEVTSGSSCGIRLRSGDSDEFYLSSDGIIPTWSTSGWTKRITPDVVAEIAEDADDFYRIACTIGGYIVFPLNRTGQTGHSINQSRGMHPQIADRFDITLECIRRHYGEPEAENPLGARLAYYADYFALFGDFDTYVRFFVLDDLVTQNRDAVTSLMTGETITEFSSPAFARSATDYAQYRERTIAFVNARNARIRELSLQAVSVSCC
jgi:hypothetical protein